MTQHPFDYDIVVIGAGSAGMRAARYAAVQNCRVAIVEGPDQPGTGVGGTCVKRGCFPKKLFMYGAAYAHTLQDICRIGSDDSPLSPPSWQALRARKDKQCATICESYRTLLTNHSIRLVEGRASFQDPHTIAVHSAASDDLVDTLTTAHTIIATGAAPALPDVEGANLATSSDQIFDLEELPASIAIVGAGRVGCELASIFAGFGSKVDLVFKDELPLDGLDKECRQAVSSNMAAQATLHACSKPQRISKLESGRLQLTCTSSKGTEFTLEADHVLMAIGRKPVIENLRLEKVRVALDSQGRIAVDAHLRTSVPHICAVGDCIAGRQHTPVALMEGAAAVQSCLGNSDSAQAAPDYTNMPSAVFCMPPLATVGLTEQDCAQRYSDAFDIYESKFRTLRDTLAECNERTLMKVIVHAASDKVVGVHIVGGDAPEILQGFAVAMKAGATKAHFDQTVGIHPTSAEELVGMRKKIRTVVGAGFQEFAAKGTKAAGNKAAPAAAAPAKAAAKVPLAAADNVAGQVNKRARNAAVR